MPAHTLMGELYANGLQGSVTVYRIIAHGSTGPYLWGLSSLPIWLSRDTEMMKLHEFLQVGTAPEFCFCPSVR